MNIKNVVKVMNFHSLLRVERSREAAKKYTYLGDTVADMIDNIVNNRNIMLDFNVLKVKPDAQTGCAGASYLSGRRLGLLCKSQFQYQPSDA